ncbi:MAG: phosphodiester glycosidase family protein, partial [Acutalibacteraceae bacterium]
MKKHKFLSKCLAVILCLAMLLSVAPMAAFAVVDNYNKDYQSETHTVFKHTEQTLAPGVTNYTNYAYSNDGKQMVYYVTTADLNRDDVVVQVAYKDMQNEEYGMDKLSNMVACANQKYSDPSNPQFISEYYSVVSACNGDGYNMTTGEPSGVFIMGGNVKKDWVMSSNPVFLAILKDGTAVIDNTQEAWDACKEAGIQEAIDIFGSNLVWDGKDVTANASGSYNTDRHSRTMVGITEDGKLVICVLDGRQEPFSCGGSMHELAQIMIEAGCVRAFNLDGGGSTTFMAKNEGTDDCVVVNRPSDGSERSISNGLIIASTAVPSNTFDHVSMVAENEFLAPGSSTSVKVTGVSPAGTSAEI